MLCQECKKKPNCVKLCPAAEKWVNQDYRYQRELTVPEATLEYISHSRSNNNINKWEDVASFFSEDKLDFPFLTLLQNKCLRYFYFEGLTYNEIALKVKIRRNAVKWQLRKAKKDILSTFTIYRKG